MSFIVITVDDEMSRGMREAHRRLREIAEDARSAMMEFKVEPVMSFRPNPQMSIAALLLSAVGMLGVAPVGVKYRREDVSGPYARKASAKKRNKFWAKNR